MKESKEENHLKENNQTEIIIENNISNKNNNKNQETFIYNWEIFKNIKDEKCKKISKDKKKLL